MVTTAARRQAYHEHGYWRDETLAERCRLHAVERGAQIAVIDRAGERQRTYAELDRDSDRVAGYLVSIGVVPGDVVAVQLPNWYETVAVDLGVFKVGAVLNPMLPIYRHRELAHMLAVGATKVLFTPTEYRGFDHAVLADSLRAQTPTLAQHVAIADPDVDGEANETWLATAPPAGDRISLDAAAVSELLFTSGTEADPKAVMHTEQTANFAARSVADSLGFEDKDVVWMPSPIGHSTGLNYGVRVALYHGLPLVLQDRWDARSAVELIERWRCSYTLVATTFVRDLVEHARSSGDDLSSLRLLGCGGATVPPELVDEAARLGACVLRLYGSTEVLVATWNRPGGAEQVRRETDGPALEHVEVEVRDDDGRAQIGVAGEIFVRGPNVSVGFFADPQRTSQTYSTDGWLRSGDIGVLDCDGNLTIVGRKKEIIIRGGLNIAPREIEELLLAHAGVEEVAVVGLPDPRLGEVACACVVARAGASVELADLVSFLRDRGLATFKLPQQLILVDRLPKTSTGKVRKAELVKEAISNAGVA
jgi:acyl-CoA synthetase (AMP-forming)/AMP-acid ligase II